MLANITKVCFVALTLNLATVGFSTAENVDQWLQTVFDNPKKLVVLGVETDFVFEGEGELVFVLEAGLGNTFRAWGPIYSQIAAKGKVFAYSRPGYGAAGGVTPLDEDQERSMADGAKILDLALEAANIDGDIVLIGHSLGANYAMTYAAENPSRIASLILIEPRLPEYDQACAQEGLPCAPMKGVTWWSENTPPHRIAEGNGMINTNETLPEAPALSGVNVTVIAAADPPANVPAAIRSQELYIAAQRNFAEALESGNFVLVPDATHFVHHDQPDSVMSAIEEAIE